MQNGCYLFASDIWTLIVSGLYRPSVSMEGLYHAMSFGICTASAAGLRGCFGSKTRKLDENISGCRNDDTVILAHPDRQPRLVGERRQSPSIDLRESGSGRKVPIGR